MVVDVKIKIIFINNNISLIFVAKSVMDRNCNHTCYCLIIYIILSFTVPKDVWWQGTNF